MNVHSCIIDNRQKVKAIQMLVDLDAVYPKGVE